MTPQPKPPEIGAGAILWLIVLACILIGYSVLMSHLKELFAP